MQNAGNLSKEETIFLSKIEDSIRICEKNNIPKFSCFLDLRQQKLASYQANSMSLTNYMFFGGFEDSERKMFGVFPDYIVDYKNAFPIDVIKIEHSRKILHRDILGTLMSIGVKRETIGDILVNENCSFVFAVTNMTEHIFNNISKIANVGVKLSLCDYSDVIIPENRFIKGTVIVSSLRLDCVVAALSNLSRADSAGLIQAEKVSVNGEIIKSVSKCISQKDVVSIRSFGKFIIGETEHVTKKGRLVLSYKKYN